MTTKSKLALWDSEKIATLVSQGEGIRPWIGVWNGWMSVGRENLDEEVTGVQCETVDEAIEVLRPLLEAVLNAAAYERSILEAAGELDDEED